MDRSAGAAVRLPGVGEGESGEGGVGLLQAAW
jgi:hypothetical protein